MEYSKPVVACPVLALGWGAELVRKRVSGLAVAAAVSLVGAGETRRETPQEWKPGSGMEVGNGDSRGPKGIQKDGEKDGSAKAGAQATKENISLPSV